MCEHIVNERCVCVTSSTMLLKVKPDGPVYEVHVTAKLITAADDVATTHLLTDAAYQTCAPGIVSVASVSSVSCSTCPVVSSLPSVTATRGQNVAAAVSDSSRRVKSNTGSTQQAHVSPLPFHHKRPRGDSQLDCNAAAKTTTSARCISGSLANTGSVENCVVAGNTVYSDDAGCRSVYSFYVYYLNIGSDIACSTSSIAPCGFRGRK